MKSSFKSRVGYNGVRYIDSLFSMRCLNSPLIFICAGKPLLVFLFIVPFIVYNWVLFFSIIHLAVHKEAIRLGHDFNHQPKITVDFICKSNWMELSQSLNNKQVLNCSLPFSRSLPDISLALTNLSFLRRTRSCWWTTITSNYVIKSAIASKKSLLFWILFHSCKCPRQIRPFFLHS